MLNTSYRQLLDDHEKIERYARDLLGNLSGGTGSLETLALKLNDLASIVEEHIKVEDRIVRDLDSSQLGEHWLSTWVDGRAAFDQLKADWTVYLQIWDSIAIGQDQFGFKLASEIILPRLRERVQQETTALYAIALQTGAISLR